MTGKDFMDDGKGRVATIPAEPHGVEIDVRRRLLSHPRLHFSSLVVRRMRDGICLEGVVETDAELNDVDRLVGSVRGVNMILNRLVLHRPAAPPKG
jgi:osmotically-inducible protein OsmY